MYLELFATLTTLIAVYLTRKENIYAWIIGILGNLTYMYIFYDTNSVFNMWLQILFISQSIYAIYLWNKPNSELPIKYAKTNILIISTFIAISAYVILYYTFNYYGIEFINLDLGTACFSLLAVYLTAKKYLQCWFYWAFANILYVSFFISRGDELSSLLYFILLINTYYGYKEWKKV